MIFVWALALSGLMLIYLEFFIPGAIMAIGGTVLLLASVFMFHLAKPAVIHLVMYTIALGSAVFFVVRFASWRQKAAAAREDSSSDEYPKEMVGKKATAATDLKPGGHIMIDDRTYQAFSHSGHIDKGADVTVIGGEGAHLIVQNKEKLGKETP